ncbi:MAG TPA: cob(I)yrinic acid a,c-diamide adenosyltransferase [Acetobacteraceae bacterium]|nr:cob(I)yrinic acid a,c-diamide adenosyltransferase [Acetobacteraceae bacterium]
MSRPPRVRIDRVVTRGGDRGETSLGDGSRVGKQDVRIEAMGAVDEANAAIGLLRSSGVPAAYYAALKRIQNDLFDVGADLCVPATTASPSRIDDSMSLRLEEEIASLNAGLAPLNSFVLPGGTRAAAEAHFARTVVRRAERAVVRLSFQTSVNGAIIRYLNRLSDYLFVLARVLNGGADVLWKPGGGA